MFTMKKYIDNIQDTVTADRLVFYWLLYKEHTSFSFKNYIMKSNWDIRVSGMRNERRKKKSR